MQGLFLLVGIVVANVLLVGTQLINAQARASYAQGERLLGSGPAGRIVAADNADFFDERRFVELRLRGFDAVAPLLQTVVRTSGGAGLELLGIDVLSMPRTAYRAEEQGSAARAAGSPADLFGQFASAPYRVLAAPARLAQLGVTAGEQLRLDNGRMLPELEAIRGGELGHRMLIDLGALQELADLRGQLSAILVFERNPARLQQLMEALPAGLRFAATAEAPDPAQLTASFHLNLAAMGLLAFVVGLFLTYNAIAFSYTDRRELIRKMRLAGVSAAQLARALLGELALFLAIGGALGIWLGSWLARALLPGVGLTLAQLYDVYIAYPDALLPVGYGLPVLMTLLAALLCALFPLRELLAAPLLARWSGVWRLRGVQRRDVYLAVTGAVLLALALSLAAEARNTWAALAGMACLLLGAALCIPLALRILLRLLSRAIPTQAARLGWLIADSRWLLGPASLALMAMTLALVANSGLNTMIGSFRSATDEWLQQRLAAQLYLRVDAGSSVVLLERLTSELAGWETPVAFTARYRMELNRTRPAGGQARIEVADLAPLEPFRSSVQLMQALPGAASDFFAGRGVYVSERAWRLDGWELGQIVELCPARGNLRVLGVYHDYGNPYSQWMVSPALFRDCWPAAVPVGIGLHGPAGIDWTGVRSRLVEEVSIEEDALVDQQALRAVGMQVFDRTFAVTRALNLLTLIVAGVGIFCSISAIHHHRMGQQALLASLGLSRRERAVMLFAQWGLLGFLCTLLVWPFGTALAWYLAAVVTPVAFGWSFPLRVELMPYLSLVGVAGAALLIAILLPSLRLLRVSPAAMLREQIP